MSQSVVERLRWLVEVEQAATIELQKHEAIPLLAAVEAAKKLDDNWEAVNRTYTVGHPYAQELRAALDALYETGEVAA